MFIERKSTCRKTHGLAQRESPTFGKCQFFRKVQFSRSSCPLRPVTFLCPLWLICLSTLPRGADAYPSQDESQSEGFWEKQDSLWPELSSDLTSTNFCHLCSVSLNRKGFFLSLSLPWLFPWGKRQRLAIYPVFVIVFYRVLNWSPAISCLRECREKGDWL